MQARSLFYCRVKKVVSQLFSAFCEAHESSKEHSTGIRHAVCAGINDVESTLLNSRYI